MTDGGWVRGRLAVRNTLRHATKNFGAMSDWYPDAEASINLCRAWATDLVSTPVLKSCRTYLFGSAIYLDGEQFDALHSDLDIVCLMPDGLSALDRSDLLVALLAHKEKLELALIPKLHREVCDEPGVSIVALTQFEVGANVHKSGARSFFDKNFFLDLITGDVQLGLNGAGDRAISEARRQALEFCQKQRNEYLSVCANGTGGLPVYRGLDPMPKALMRSAAQIAPNLPEGAWYDTRHGLEYIFEVLNDCRDEDPRLRSLYKVISIRRGGKGRKEGLSSEQQLILSELLFDQACIGATDEVVQWELRLSNSSQNDESAQIAYDAVRRLVPDARLLGVSNGGELLTLASSLRAYELFLVLFELRVLKEALSLDVLDVRRLEAGAPQSLPPSGSYMGQLRSFLENWNPAPTSSGRITEAEIVQRLRAELARRLRIDSGLLGGEILDRVEVLPQVNFDSGERLDLVLSWGADSGHVERIGLEVSAVKSINRLHKDLEFMMRVPFPAVLLVFLPAALADEADKAIHRLHILRPYIQVIVKKII